MWQSVSRTVRRVATRQELWSGNRETWRGLLFWSGADSIVGWAWTSYARAQDRYSRAMADPTWSHLRFRRLRTRRQVDRLVAQVEADGARRR